MRLCTTSQICVFETKPQVAPLRPASPDFPSASAFEASPPLVFAALLFLNDCSKSWMISSICSYPTEMRIRSSVTPESSLSCSLNCSCVVFQGWIASVLPSPTLHRGSVCGPSVSNPRIYLLGQIRDQVKVIHDLTASGASAFDTERQDTAKTAR